MKNWMESTDAGTVANYSNKNWLRFRKDRTLTDGAVWVFSDGSSSGWHGAIILDVGKSIRYLCQFEETPNLNINPELNGALVGLRVVEPKQKIYVVHDYLGVGAWLTNSWNIEKPAVQAKVDAIRQVIAERELDVHFIHHAGHQNKKKGNRPICTLPFTKWNCAADKLCSSKTEQDRTGPWEG